MSTKELTAKEKELLVMNKVAFIDEFNRERAIMCTCLAIFTNATLDIDFPDDIRFGIQSQWDRFDLLVQAVIERL